MLAHFHVALKLPFGQVLNKVFVPLLLCLKVSGLPLKLWFTQFILFVASEVERCYLINIELTCHPASR